MYIEKVLKRFDVSLEWLMGSIQMKDGEMETIRQNESMDEREKDDILRAKKMKSVADILEEVDVLIDLHFYNEFSKIQSSLFLKRVMENQNAIDVRTFKKTWRTLNCTPKNNEDYRGDPGESPLCWEEESVDHKKNGAMVLLQPVGAVP